MQTFKLTTKYRARGTSLKYSMGSEDTVRQTWKGKDCLNTKVFLCDHNAAVAAAATAVVAAVVDDNGGGGGDDDDDDDDDTGRFHYISFYFLFFCPFLIIGSLNPLS